ncbi:MAG: hypothetical protein KI791_17555 [Cyclobacteriaceae bacterium]|nr:hypothetical protein [Cyclobacteriaceae bacterium SS2]
MGKVTALILGRTGLLLKLMWTFSISFLLSIQAFSNTGGYTKQELLSELIKLNDERIPEVLGRQWTEKDHIYYGAVYDHDSVVSPGATSGLIQYLMTGYVSEESKYYKSKDILVRMEMAAEGLVNLQHEDGTIDLLSTNFHSTPDLGFTIYPLAHAYQMMLQHKKLDFGTFPETIKKYLLNAGKALSVGGIHTPNHRWVVSGALAWLYSFFPNETYRSRVDQWMAEKIDIDPDGQYHERSTSVYTPVTNRSLLVMAQKMGYTELYDVIRKNLDMTFYFVRSTGEIATESSKRQDKYVQSDMSKYYLAYNYMALQDKDARYAGMVKYIEDTVPVEHLSYMLPHLLTDEQLMQPLADGEPLPTNYHKYFKYSDMARIRRGDVDMSIITDNPIFLTYFKGEAALEAVRLASAFFGKGQFSSQQMERVDENTYKLTSTIFGPYYQPLPKEKLPAEGEAWGQVSRTEREQSEVQKLMVTILVKEHNGKATVNVKVDGPKNLPVTLELGFRTGGELRNVIPRQRIDQAFMAIPGEFAIYKYNEDEIRVGPGVIQHNWTQLRGALPKLEADCLYFTNYAPCEFEFTLE